MILPIVAYGSAVLRKKTEEISANDTNLQQLVSDMFETMYNAKGVGLAAPQIGKPIRLFVVDAAPFAKEEAHLKDYKKVFINPTILEESGDIWHFNEGCLSIPDIHEDVPRKKNIRIRYHDANWQEHEEEITGMAARIIQHEYDHIEGKLFTDLLPPLKKRMLQGKLNNISNGRADVTYKMKFASIAKKGRR